MTTTLHLGDCLDPVSGMASLPDKSVDHVITDPPYDEHVHAAGRRGRTDFSGERAFTRATLSRARDLGFAALNPEDMVRAAVQFGRVVQRWALVFCSIEMVSDWRVALGNAGLEYIRTGLWIKEGCTPQFTGDRPAVGAEAIIIAHRPGKKTWNGGGSHAVWSCPIVLNRGGISERVHTTQKPLALMEKLVSLFTDPGDLILDPFAGSGTTGCAAIRNGRRFLGWERDERYHAIATKRIGATREQLTLGGVA